MQNLTKFIIKLNNKIFNLKTTRTYLGPKAKCTHYLFDDLIGKKLANSNSAIKAFWGFTGTPQIKTFGTTKFQLRAGVKKFSDARF